MTISDYATGLQHVGVPTRDLEQSRRFYQQLGFVPAMQTRNGDQRVEFFRLGTLVVEVWEDHAAGHVGAIDHFTVDVTDIQPVYWEVVRLGLPIVEDGIQQLPYWERGIRFFTVVGPNQEKVEFSQML